MSRLHDLIPGLKEAEQEYKENQLEAFADVEPNIAGFLPVRPFTPQMFVELDGARNGFLHPRTTGITVEDVCQFLWRVSIGFRRTDNAEQDAKHRQLFHAVLGTRLDAATYPKAMEDVSAYLLRTWECMPMWPGGNLTSMGVWPSRLVHMFAREYGWTEEYVMNKPFRRLWQYANRILEGQSEKYVQRSPRAMRIRAEWLARINAEAGKN